MLRTYLRDIEFPDGAHVLDVGCGTGAITRVLAAWQGVGEAVGVDPSPFLIDKARTLSSDAANLRFETGDGKALELHDASVDVVVLHTVLTHVPGPEALLAEAHRVLRPGGWWVSVTATSRRQPLLLAMTIRCRHASKRLSRDS
jgi:arsenite methyltransferase